MRRVSHSPTADVSVRVAWADDAEAIAAVQVRAWQVLYADVVPADVLPTDPAVSHRPGARRSGSRPTPATASWWPSSATGSSASR